MIRRYGVIVSFCLGRLWRALNGKRNYSYAILFITVQNLQMMDNVISAKSKRNIYIAAIVLFTCAFEYARESRNDNPVMSLEQIESRASKIDAYTFMNEYNANEVAADRNYKDHVVEITGTIHEISVALGSPCVSLNTGKYYQYILCYGIPENQAAQLGIGQTITILGTCYGKIITSIAVHGCILR